jgi:hypothetical protein
LSIELRRVFRPQLVPCGGLEEDRHGVVPAAELGNLIDDFVGNPHGPIVLAILCYGKPRPIGLTSSSSPCPVDARSRTREGGSTIRCFLEEGSW